MNKKDTSKAKTHFSDIEFHCHYPEENPDTACADITRVLNYTGVFCDVDKDKN